MPPNPVYGGFKSPEMVNVSRLRRVRHSVTNRLSAARLGTGGEAAGSAVGAVISTAGQVNAWSTVSGAASVAALAGPQAAGVLGVIAIAQLVKGTYSNRDRAHGRLTPYVWSLIDDEQPRTIGFGESDEVGAAAYRLIIEGDSQFRLMTKKFDARANKYNSFVKKLAAPGRSSEQNSRDIDEAMKQGGAIFEYMRRLNHLANYMQAFSVYHKIMNRDFTPLTDIAAIHRWVPQLRADLDQHADLILDVWNSNPAFR